MICGRTSMRIGFIWAGTNDVWQRLSGLFAGRATTVCRFVSRSVEGSERSQRTMIFLKRSEFYRLESDARNESFEWQTVSTETRQRMFDTL